MMRATASAVKHEDDRRLFHNAGLRKRQKEMGDQMDPMRRLNRVKCWSTKERIKQIKIGHTWHYNLRMLETRARRHYPPTRWVVSKQLPRRSSSTKIRMSSEGRQQGEGRKEPSQYP